MTSWKQSYRPQFGIICVFLDVRMTDVWLSDLFHLNGACLFKPHVWKSDCGLYLLKLSQYGAGKIHFSCHRVLYDRTWILFIKRNKSSIGFHLLCFFEAHKRQNLFYNIRVSPTPLYAMWKENAIESERIIYIFYEKSSI